MAWVQFCNILGCSVPPKLRTSFVLLQPMLLYKMHTAISAFYRVFCVGMKSVPNNLIASKKSALSRSFIVVFFPRPTKWLVESQPPKACMPGNALHAATPNSLAIDGTSTYIHAFWCWTRNISGSDSRCKAHT